MIFLFSREMKLDKPGRSFWNCCAKKPVMITQVKVIKAEGLEKQESAGLYNLYYNLYSAGFTKYLNTLNPFKLA